MLDEAQPRSETLATHQRHYVRQSVMRPLKRSPGAAQLATRESTWWFEGTPVDAAVLRLCNESDFLRVQRFENRMSVRRCSCRTSERQYPNEHAFRPLKWEIMSNLWPAQSVTIAHWQAIRIRVAICAAPTISQASKTRMASRRPRRSLTFRCNAHRSS